MPMEEMTIPASTEALPEESAAEETVTEETVTEETGETVAADQDPGSVEDSVKIIYLTPDGTMYSSSDALTPDSVSSGDAGGGAPYSTVIAESADYSEYYEQLLANSETLIEQNARIQEQNEACIILLVIIVVVGLLNYVYKFFKIFF